MQLDIHAARKEVLNLMYKVEREQEHVIQVCKLSLLLFDQISTSNDCEMRLVLESAALLHDIGWSIKPDGRGHHKASERMILEHSWRWLPKPFVSLIANVARYHRKSLPKPSHPRFATLSKEQQHSVRELAGILRMADALDRSHMQLVSGLRCKLSRRSLLIYVTAAGELGPERVALAKKSDLFSAERELSVELISVGGLESIDLDQERIG